MKELHLTKKDFDIDWFSGTGKGGQHRNKHQNCCRITHINSNIRAQSTEHRERSANQAAAFKRLAALLIAHYCPDEKIERYKTSDTVRNYHAVRNEVHDKRSGLKQTYKYVVLDGNLKDMIESNK